jgi:hypothetical protein
VAADQARDRRIFRQALAGLIWTKQFFHYDLERWLAGDRLKPPAARLRGRNVGWRHLEALDQHGGEEVEVGKGGNLGGAGPRPPGVSGAKAYKKNSRFR